MIDYALLVVLNTIFATLTVFCILGLQERIDLGLDIVRVIFSTLNEDADVAHV